MMKSIGAIVLENSDNHAFQAEDEAAVRFYAKHCRLELSYGPSHVP